MSDNDDGHGNTSHSNSQSQSVREKRTQITYGFGMSENGVVTARKGHFNETNSDELMNHRIYEFVSTDFSRQTLITSRKMKHPHNVVPPSSKLLYFHP